MPTISPTGPNAGLSFQEEDSEEVKDVRVRTRRNMLLENLANEMSALERMNPKVSLRSIAVRGLDKDGGCAYENTLATFVGHLCTDAFLREHGDLGEVVDIQLLVDG
jgi:hypothetical protein